MKKLKEKLSILLLVTMGFYGFASVIPAVALADNGSGHGNNRSEQHSAGPVSVSNSNSSSSSASGNTNNSDHSNHGSMVSAVASSHSSDDGVNHGSIVSSVANSSNNSNSSSSSSNSSSSGSPHYSISTGWNSTSTKSETGDDDSGRNGSHQGGDDQNENGHWHGGNGGGTASTTASMPVISGITAPTVLPAGQVGTWTVNAFDPSNGSLSYSVDWGDTPVMHAMALSTSPVFVQTSTFTHSYSNPGIYTVTFTVENSAGNKTTSTVTVDITSQSGGGGGVSLPVISGATATGITQNGATIDWTTDTNSSSLVWFGTSTPVDTSGAANVTDNNSVTSHEEILSNLLPGTQYYAVVGSGDSAGVSTSSEISFMTSSAATSSAPVITSLTGPTSVIAGQVETVTVNASDPNNSSLSYSVNWGDNPPLMMAALSTSNPFVQTATFSHVYNTAGTYTAMFTVKNSAGLEASSSLTIIVSNSGGGGGGGGLAAPVISGVSATNVSTSSASVIWNTDVSSDSKIFIGTTTPVVPGGMGVTELDSATTTTSHQMNISSLSASTTYYFIVTSSDSTGTSTSTENSFTTSGITSIMAPVISGVTVANNTTGTTTNVTWTTDTPSTSAVWVGTSTPLVIGSSAPAASSTTLTTSHDLSLSGLTASTTYYYIVGSTDASSNMSTSTELSFTTPALPTFTLADIALHNTAGDCWTAINGSVYDLTSFIPSHPGGSVITSICGIDGTTILTSSSPHGIDSNVAAILATLKIGTLAP